MEFIDFLQFCEKNLVRFSMINGQLKITAPKNFLTPENTSHLRKYKSELITWIESSSLVSGLSFAPDTPISVADRSSHLPLSFGQEELWLTHKLNDIGACFHFVRALEFIGEVDVGALNAAFNTIFERHEVLRTVFVERDGVLSQRVLSPSLINVPTIDIRGLDKDSLEFEVAKVLRTLTYQPFDLACDLMLRAQLVRLGKRHHQLIIVIHHIASDGWSLGVFISEFQKIYTANVKGIPYELPILPIQYSDYSAWQRALSYGDNFSISIKYWEDKLKNVPEVHNLPLDYSRPLVRSFNGGCHKQHLDCSTKDLLQQFALRSGVTLFIVLESLFVVLLAKYSDSEEIILGTPVANRMQKDVTDLIGYFANLLVLRHRIDIKFSFKELIQQIKRDVMEAFSHQHIPFEKVVQSVVSSRSNKFSPLVQIAFVMQNNSIPTVSLPNISCQIIEPEIVNSFFEIQLSVSETSSGLDFSWEYMTDLFEERTIANMADRFARLVDGVLINPDLSIGALDMLAPVERHQLLVEWNDTAKDYPKDRCIHELFEAQVEKNPEAIALIFEESQLTYGELNVRANQLAHYLVSERQVKPDTLIGICVERSLEMVVAILAILKSGGAYVPLDPDYPEARLAYMLEDAKLDTVITQHHLLSRLPVTLAQAICIDAADVQVQLETQSVRNLDPHGLGLTSQHLAYVIYTSGSTGNPKGCLIQHSGLLNLTGVQQKYFNVTQNSHTLQFSSIAFDAAISELMVTLCAGARLVLIHSAATMSASLLELVVTAQKITHVTLPPAILPLLNPLKWATLSTLVVAGEACNIQLANLWANKRRFINAYGPSEASICATMGIYQSGQSILSIGKPLDNVQVFVLNSSSQPVPYGITGELHIGGAGLARGYLNRPELTAEKFIPNPFYDSKNPNSSERLYKTGDLVRWLPDGNLEFLGRIDHQVKIRGFRIELGEIENVLCRYAGVKDAVVLARESLSGDKRLVAYVVSEAMEFDQDVEYVNTQQVFIDALRSHAHTALPDYMIPSAFMLLDALPLTPNGKVDRKALPEPDFTNQSDYVAPRTETEKILCEIWQEVLGVERVGVTDNFFHLGGHSLLATQLIARINQILNVTVPLKTLFEVQVLKILAQAILQLNPGLDRPPLTVVMRENTLTLSYAQQRLWLLDQIDNGSAHYNMPGALRLLGDIDHGALNFAFTCILERHESLRTCFFVEENGRPYQCIQPALPFHVEVKDVSAIDNSLRSSVVQKIMLEEATQGFDLRRDLMLRAKLIKVTMQENILLVTMHHIASDGWSMAILINEFSVLYRSYVEGRNNPLPALEIQYADYAHWQRMWLQGEVLENQLLYWEKQLANLPQSHNVPLDYPRPKMQSFSGRVYVSQIQKNIADTLKTLCREHGATLFMGLHSAFSVLLSRYSNEQDIVVGSPIANREQAEIAPLIGFFVNTLVLRSDLSNDPSFTELLLQSKHMLLDAYAHQQVPFEQIVERLQPERSLSHSPLFQIMLVLQNNEEASLELPGLTLSPVEQMASIAKYDFTLTVTEQESGLHLNWEYNTDLFEESTIRRMAIHFDLLVAALVAAPGESVFKGDMLSEAERHQLLIEWNDTAKDYPKDRCIHELFEAQVEKNPEAIALIFEESQLTYGELNVRANQLAHYLVSERQVKPDTLIGICVERSLEMVVAILAILKSGGAYVPLDPDYPEARLAYMLEDAKLDTVITQHHLLSRLPVTLAQAICIDAADVQVQLETQSVRNLDPHGLGLTSQHLAYVIYTSGSTGNPKGVMIEHRNTVAFLYWVRAIYDANCLSCVLASTSINFDLSVFEFFGPLSWGGSALLIVHVLELQNKQYSKPLTLINTVPSVIESLLSNDCIPASVKTINLAGEPLKQKLVNELYFSNIDNVYDLYGPSEDTTYSTFVIRKVNGVNCIGKPIDNTQMYILGKDNELSPLGLSGELHIGGAGLARGYLNRPELTAEKFIPNPFYDSKNPNSSERLYKTGDLVRWLPDGNLEFLGRIDHQVKIRGFRIELGEIENVLCRYAGVKDAVVLARESLSGDKRLVAYVVSEAMEFDQDVEYVNTQQVFIDALRSHAHTALPDYMIPSAFMLLDALPLTPNGKVDRKALPEPDFTNQSDYVAPRTETEKILCEIWQEVLGVERVGVTDNFFHLGGHSLLVVQVISRLQKQEISMSVSQLFTTPTVQDLALIINTSAAGFKSIPAATANLIPINCENITPDMLPLVNLSVEEIQHVTSQIAGGVSNIKDIYPLGPLQEGILFHHVMSSASDPYVLPVLFRINGRDRVSEFLNALQFVIDRHDVLRTAVFWQDLLIPVQVVCRHVDLPVAWTELESNIDALTHAESLCAPEVQKMDLSIAPLLKLQIVHSVDSEQYFVVLQMHHIVSDHVGLEIIQREMELYQSNQVQILPESVPYREFVAHALHQAVHNNAEVFFRSKLGDIEEPTLPFGLINVQGDGSSIVEAKEIIEVEVSKKIRQAAKLLMITPATIFHAAWAMVIANCSNREDVVFGTVLSGRLQGTIGAENMLGVFINTLPLRVQLNNISAIELVRQVHGSLLDLLPYEQASLALAQRCTGLLGGVPLFSAILNYRHSISSVKIDGNVDIEVLAGQERTNYPFNLSVDDFGDGFALDVQVDSSVSALRIIGYMQTAIVCLLNALQVEPEQLISTMSLLPKSESDQLLIEWNDTAKDYPKDRCIHELFEAQVEKNPEAIALIFEGSQLTYGELNVRANQLAHYLVSERQVKPDTLIGICIERSLEMVVAILAILKSGGAYVPLDPDYPEARLAYMLEDAKLDTVITQHHLLSRLPVTLAQAICIDAADVQVQLETQSVRNLDPHGLGLTSQHLAYVIYTSGSTGNPKGVMIEQNNVVNFLLSMLHRPAISSHDCLLAVTSTSFDIHGLEIFLPLLVGAKIVVASKTAVSNPESLMNLMIMHNISVMQATPATWKMLLNDNWRPLAPLKVLCGGEAISESLASSLCASRVIELWNMYGPTETTIWSCINQITQNDEKLSMGTPIDNTSMYVINDMRLALCGVPGELHIGGAGLARGYLNRPELTAEKFIPNPFYDSKNPNSSERLYKTGDLVRWLPDGNLEFLGRIDHQVKIRGFRIELGEIENVLCRYAGVKDAVVLARESSSGDKRLVAYVVSEAMEFDQDVEYVNTQQVFIDALRSHAHTALPDYMIPSAFMLLDALPLTPNGKVDRKALPEPDFTNQSDYVAPRTETEKILCEIFKHMFRTTEIGLESNFFHLGGDSLSVMKLISLAKKSGLNISARDVIEKKTIRAISKNARAYPITHEFDVELILGDTECELLPEQQWFFSENYKNPQHFNTASMISVSENLNAIIAKQSLLHVMKIHDMLRAKFCKNNDKMKMVISLHCEHLPFEYFDFSNFSNEVQNDKIKDVCESYHTRFSIFEGPLFYLAYFDRGEESSPLLFYAVNHLIADGASIEIFAEDFMKTYWAILEGRHSELPQKTYSIKVIADTLKNVVVNNKIEETIRFWEGQPWCCYEKYKTDYVCGNELNTVSSVKDLHGGLSSYQTDLIVDLVVKKWKIPLIDVIYYAISKALSGINDGEFIPIWHVASGRGFISANSNQDMSNAMGWFSMPSPRFIKVGEDKVSYDELKKTHKYLNDIPGGGCSYLPLWFSNSSFREKIPFFPDEDKVVLNHLGYTFDSARSDFPEYFTASEDPDNYRSCLFKCETRIHNGELTIRWLYSKNQYREETVQRLITEFLSVLQTLSTIY